VAIQSASALSAYLTADSSASIGAGIPERPTPGTPAPAGAGEGKVGAVDREQEQAPEDGGPPSVETALPPLYGSNARSVAAGMRTASLSLFA